MKIDAKWIGKLSKGDEIALYKKVFVCDCDVKSAKLQITACGNYTVLINGKQISYPLAPGYSCYGNRLEVQTYQVKNLVVGQNTIEISVAPGWFKWYDWMPDLKRVNDYRSVIACLTVTDKKGNKQTIRTDQFFKVFSSKTVSSSIYDGEVYDATAEEKEKGNAEIINVDIPLINSKALVIKEHEVFYPLEIIKTPKGELVLDFGQNITGYVCFTVRAKSGQKIVLSHGEVLDKFGNFYNDNYRSAKSMVEYTCVDGVQTYKPQFSFMGFRYVRLDKYPENLDLSGFKAIAVYSNIKRTGYINSSSEKLNKLYSNAVWGQKDNFLDIPTDCPQRDERLGWLGDAQVFCKAANYNFNCKKFFARFVDMIGLEQKNWGHAPDIVPNSRGIGGSSCAWSDASTIIPSTLYDFYGDVKLLRTQFRVMQHQVDRITKTTKEEFLWVGGEHFGDWLALDGEDYTGSTNIELIASCYYAYSVSLLIKAGKILGKDISKYEYLYDNIVKKIKEKFPHPRTQTECVLLLHFNLTDYRDVVTKKLVSLIENNGFSLQTGFIGTPLLLHALSENGRCDIAYKLLLKESYPSWLYSVNCGATTIWEHWDSKNENGDFWDKEMNSFNHYALGSVIDWIYSVAGGITAEQSGFKRVKLNPHPTDSLEYLTCSFKCKYGTIISQWYHENGKIKYYFDTPVPATICIDGKTFKVEAGVYDF